MLDRPDIIRSRGDRPRKRRKRPVNLTLDADLVEQSKAMGINLSDAAEAGIRHANAERWKQQNKAAIEGSNRWVEQNGLPFEKYKLF